MVVIRLSMSLESLQSGTYGKGQFITVVIGDKLRFTGALALGDGILPRGNCIKEEDLNHLVPDGDNANAGKGYFIVEVQRDDLPDEGALYRLLEGAVKAGFYKEVINTMREMGLDTSYELYRFKGEPVVQTSHTFPNGDKLEVVGWSLGNEQGELMFVYEYTYMDKDILDYWVNISDGKVYPYDTMIKIDPTFFSKDKSLPSVICEAVVILSNEPIRDATDEEWNIALSYYGDIEELKETSREYFQNVIQNLEN